MRWHVPVVSWDVGLALLWGLILQNPSLLVQALIEKLILLIFNSFPHVLETKHPTSRYLSFPSSRLYFFFLC